MRTPDEIKRGLYSPAETAEFLRIRTGIIHDRDKLYRSALALIERLDKDCVDAESKATALYDRVKQLEAERDAAVSELIGTCQVCRWEETEKCASCHFNADAWNVHESNWEWRGLPEPPKEDAHG